MAHASPTDDDARGVARLSRSEQRSSVRGALGWHRLLRPRGVPIPALLASLVEPEDGPLPAMILERPPARTSSTSTPH